MMFSYFGLPTIEGNEDLGASSPERPALHIPDPLSITTGVPCSVILCKIWRNYMTEIYYFLHLNTIFYKDSYHRLIKLQITL